MSAPWLFFFLLFLPSHIDYASAACKQKVSAFFPQLPDKILSLYDSEKRFSLIGSHRLRIYSRHPYEKPYTWYYEAVWLCCWDMVLIYCYRRGTEGGGLAL